MEEVPFDDRHVPRAEIDWDRSAWWWRPLTRTIQPATKMISLFTALVALWLARTGVQLSEWLFTPDWSRGTVEVAATGTLQSQLWGWVAGLLQALLGFGKFGVNELAFVSFCALWLALVFSIFGGVIARRGLVELGQQTVAPWGESFRLVLSRWQSYLWATGMHLVGIAVMLLPIFALGLLSRFGSIGASIAGVLLLICYPLVFGVGRFALSMLICFPLSVCAIAAEKRADAFEGFSRSNAYLFQRPFVAAICAIALFFVGSVGEQIVYWTLTLGWGIVRGAYFYGGGLVQPASNDYVATGNWLVVELVRAYWFSFLWTGAAALYLILRKSVDHTEMDEMDCVENPIEETLPVIPTTPPAANAEPVAEGTGESVPSEGADGSGS